MLPPTRIWNGRTDVQTMEAGRRARARSTSSQQTEEGKEERFPAGARQVLVRTYIVQKYPARWSQQDLVQIK